MEYKNIKIPEATYDAVRRAQVELVKNGVNNVPSEIMHKCPFCKTNLNTITTNYSYAECPKCNFQQQQFNVNAGGTFALGIVIGLGVAALISALGKK